jgi:DNA ligase-1
MTKLAEAGERIAATTKKLEKIAIVAEYLKARTPEEASISAVFLSGRPFPVWEEATLQVGGRVLWRLVAELSRKSDGELTAAYREHGDLGDVAEAVLPASCTTAHIGKGAPARPGREVPGSSALSLPDVAAKFREIATARGAAAKTAMVRELLSQASSLEAKYIIKIMTGDLRIGLKESLVEEAIARAFGGTLAGVQRANMLLGDIGETLKLAVANKLGDARMRLFHPLGFLLASPAESAEKALSYFEALVEDKLRRHSRQALFESEVKFSRASRRDHGILSRLPEALAGFAGPHSRGEIVLGATRKAASSARPRRLSWGRPAHTV